ncbi:MAG: sodium/solute symporter [Pirellulales bacterium]|nr:sodium/solute symporter [Pirellulales bacterium]
MPVLAAVADRWNAPIPPADAGVVLAYLAAIVGLGVWAGRGHKTTADYFLGGRSLPTWTILLSIVATETSTVTFLSIPGLTFAAKGNMTFLQITFGYIVGRIVTAVVLLPLYFRGELFTAYEVLQGRFGGPTRRLAAALFLVTRNVSDALRLYLTALVLREAAGMPFATCVLLIGAVTIAYTYFGGVKSVVWNDCLQFVVYVAGAAAALGVIVHRLPEGWGQLWEFGRTTGRLQVLDFAPTLLGGSMTFWAGVVGGGFLTAATHGTDQLTVQRLLSARSQRSATTALVASGLVVCAQFALFLIIGIALACFYATYPPPTPFGAADNDRAFASFIVNHLPQGLTGLTLAAVFAAAMSTLSSSLNSSATALVNDLLPGRIYRDALPERQLMLGKFATAVFGAVQVGGAILANELGATTSVVNSVLMIAAFAMGPTLGLYMLAALAPRVQQRPALVGFVTGIVVLAWIARTTDVYWPWYAAIGALATFAIAAFRQWGEGPLAERARVQSVTGPDRS